MGRLQMKSSAQGGESFQQMTEGGWELATENVTFKHSFPIKFLILSSGFLLHLKNSKFKIGIRKMNFMWNMNFIFNKLKKVFDIWTSVKRMRQTPAKVSMSKYLPKLVSNKLLVRFIMGLHLIISNLDVVACGVR